MLSKAEKSELVMLFVECDQIYNRTAEEFNRRHPNRPPVWRFAVQRIIRRFSATGSVEDRIRSGHRRSGTDDSSSTMAFNSIFLVCEKPNLKSDIHQPHLFHPLIDLLKFVRLSLGDMSHFCSHILLFSK